MQNESPELARPGQRLAILLKPAARIAGIACASLVALALPSGALAAPTGSQIAAPSDPAFVTVDADNPGTLHVAGTTSGGSGDVDLRCYTGSDSKLIASAVPVVAGAFAADVPLTMALSNSLGTARCRQAASA